MVRGSLGKGDLIPGGSAQPLGRRLGNPPPGTFFEQLFSSPFSKLSECFSVDSEIQNIPSEAVLGQIRSPVFCEEPAVRHKACEPLEGRLTFLRFMRIIILAITVYFRCFSYTQRSTYTKSKYSDEKKNVTAYIMSSTGIFWKNLED